MVGQSSDFETQQFDVSWNLALNWFPSWICEHFTLEHRGVEKGGGVQARYHKNST
jgi:hypothetical protein